MTENHDAPAAWVGCLACYNNGDLVGGWVAAVDAEGLTSADVHGTHPGAPQHDELWVFDHEHIPVDGEISPQLASLWGRLIESVQEDLRSPLRAWVDAAAPELDEDGLPSVEAFQEAYAGRWPSFQDYAQELAGDTGLLDRVPEDLKPYFDWRKWSRDLEPGHTVADAPGSEVYVFRD